MNLLKEFSSDKNIIAKFETDYKNSSLKYSELKPVLAEAIIAALKPIQERRAELLKDKKYVTEILAAGAIKAHAIADKNLLEIKKLIGIL